MDAPLEISARAPVGVLCALPEELGRLPRGAERERSELGLDVLRLELAGRPVLACAAGVGKVRAALGAAALICGGARGALLVVGVCGGLRRGLGAGTLVHCTRAVQADLAVREEREVEPDPGLRDAWCEAAPGERGWFLTADRPALSVWRQAQPAPDRERGPACSGPPCAR